MRPALIRRRTVRASSGRAACIAMALLAVFSAGLSQGISPTSWDGGWTAYGGQGPPARSFAIHGGTGYLGGNFSAIYKPMKSCLRIDLATGQPLSLPGIEPQGNVFTSIADGQGGWFIGGDFLSVGGVPRQGLARSFRAAPSTSHGTRT